MESQSKQDLGNQNLKQKHIGKCVSIPSICQKLTCQMSQKFGKSTYDISVSPHWPRTGERKNTHFTFNLCKTLKVLGTNFSSGRGSRGEVISLGIAGVMGDDPILGSAVTQTGRPQAQRSMQNTFEDAARLAKWWLIKRKKWWEIAVGGG